jgi:hypothetical protein
VRLLLQASCAMIVSTASAMNKPYWLMIIAFSIASIAPTAAVLLAGSPGYGPISEVWKHVSVPALLAIGFGLLIVGARCLSRGSKLLGLKAYLVPLLFLSTAAVPLTCVALLVTLQAGGVGG